jgi:predicted PurR-regulated permease PerM
MEPVSAPPELSPLWQQLARVLLVTLLVAAGLWILHQFLAALAWATVFAIALWPLNLRLVSALPDRIGPALAPVLLTVAIAIVFIAPVVLLGVVIAHEAHFVVQFIGEARHQGIPVPDWIPQLPLLGPTAAEWWRANLSDPDTIDELFGRMGPHMLGQSAREYAREIIHRVVIFLFTLLTVFFLFRDGGALSDKLRNLSDRALGARGERIAMHMIAAVHGTVNGLVLVGLAEGLVLAAVYFAVHLPYAASLGALTGVAAIIPFAAPVVYCLAALYLFAAGNTIGGIVIVIAGSVVVFVADHFVRPVLIGGAARLPFLWVLLGILGGLETFGFLGLFVGPAVMAALIALWRDWTEPVRLPARPRSASPRRSPAARPARSRKS